jgi:CRISPR/Cas system-associated protein Csm6
MPRHELEIALPPKVVLNSDVVIEVKSDDAKLGELRISRGTIDWVPGKHVSAFRMSWEQFDELMREHGRRRVLH